MLKDNDIVDIARKYKEDVIIAIRRALSDESLENDLPERVAMLIDGAIISETLYRGSGALDNAKLLALSLIRQPVEKKAKRRSN